MTLIGKSHTQHCLIGFLQMLNVRLFSFPPRGLRKARRVTTRFNDSSNLRSESIGHLVDFHRSVFNHVVEHSCNRNVLELIIQQRI